MPTTTLRLSDSLKVRIASAAKRAQKSPHSFMIDALDQLVTQAELRADFERTATERLAQLSSTGMALDWADTRKWLEARALGKRAAKPKAKKLVPRR